MADITAGVIVREAPDDMMVGDHVGVCKWFADMKGYGFITVQSGTEKGKDIFVHHTGIKPLNSNYKTLKKGEYINFFVINGENGLQAVNVTGIGGGTLMCDVIPMQTHHQNRYEYDSGTVNNVHGNRNGGRGPYPPAPPPLRQ